MSGPVLAGDSNDLIPVWTDGLRVGVFAPVTFDRFEARIGHTLGDTAEGGILVTRYVEGEDKTDARDWGFGVYGKYIVDPGATIPVADWLPKFGSWLDLPETVTAQTYLIGKGQVIPLDEGLDLSGSIGAGMQISVAVVEWTYDFIESGDSDEPQLSSGSTLWVALVLPF